MKVLSLTQPYATLVALGEKKFETRTWSTSHVGPLAIHAAKGFPQWAQDLCVTEPFYQALYVHIDSKRELPLGAIIAVVDVGHVFSTNRDDLHNYVLPAFGAPHEAAFGDYGPNRYIWILSNVRVLPEPIPARGALGLWTFEHPTLDALATVGDASMA